MTEKTVDQLKKEIEKLKKQLAAEAPARKKKANKATENEKFMNEMVTIKLFKDNGRYKDDVFVAVNDRTYLIKRGTEVSVPRFVEQALKNSLAQDEYVAAMIDRLVSNYERDGYGE